MKLNLNSIKKNEQVIFKADSEISADNIGFTQLVNSITNAKVYFLIYEAKAYVDIDFIARKLQLSKSQIFSMIDEDNILVDSYTYREGVHYYLSIEDALILVKDSAVTNKDKHTNGLQYVFNKALEKYAKTVDFKIACEKLKDR